MADNQFSEERSNNSSSSSSNTREDSPNKSAVDRIVRRKNFYVKKECFFTKNKVKYIDYRNIDLIGKFISRNGAILPARITGVKMVHQRKLAKAIKRARYMALLPFSGEFKRN